MQTANGIVTLRGEGSVDEIVQRLSANLNEKGVKLFTIVDHSGEAAKAGLQMPNTKLLIFGNPKGGTPLMLSSPSIALDLPLKILVAEDPSGQAWLSYNSPEFLRHRHELQPDLAAVLSAVETFAASAARTKTLNS